MNYYNLKKEVACGGDLDVFISGLVETPSEIDFTNYEVSQKVGSVNFKRSDFHESLQDFSVGCYPLDNLDCEFTLTVLSQNHDEFAQTESSLLTDSFAENSTKGKCDNCLQYVPIRTIQMHTAFCERNNKGCKKCGKVFKKDLFEFHYHCELCNFHGDLGVRERHNRVHEQLTCACGEKYELCKIPAHKKICPKRYCYNFKPKFYYMQILPFNC